MSIARRDDGEVAMIVHQMWLDERDPDAGPPARYLTPQFCGGFRAQEGLAYKFWRGRDIERLLAEHEELARWRALYKRVRLHIQRCDLARYMVLWLFGGLYCDLDFQALRPLRAWLTGREMLLTLELTNTSQTLAHRLLPNTVTVCNGFLASAPRHPFWPALLDYIAARYDPALGVLETTGPAMLGRFCAAARCGPRDRPSWYVDNCLVLPERRSGLRAGCVRTLPYVTTKWNEGSGWAMSAPAIKQSARAAMDDPFAWLLLTSLLAAAAAASLARSRRPLNRALVQPRH